MGLLIDGQWHDRWYDTGSTGGRFERQASLFRNVITADGSSGFDVRPGRYQLYVSMACPWAHRALIFRLLKGLEQVISVAVVDPRMGSEGWTFAEPDPLLGATRLHQVYTEARADYTGRVTVPVLWDREHGTIVSNESSEIIRFFNRAFDVHGDAGWDFYPADLRTEIDAINNLVYHRVNNGVYRAGFATAQAAHDEAVGELFDALDQLERLLSRQRYLVGDRITEADWRLFTTLIRFDAVYHGHFKCNLRRLVDYPNLWGHTRELYQWPGVASTVDLEQIKTHYYWSHTSINPTRVIPRGPELDLDRPHGRDRLRVAQSAGL